MPTYRVYHPEFAKPRAVEAASPKTARAYVAREFAVTKIGSRELYELASPEEKGGMGVELVLVEKRSG